MKQTVTGIFLCGLLLGCVQQDTKQDTQRANGTENSVEQPLYLSLKTPPAPIQSAEDALQDFVIAPGFEIELVAVEPLVEDPVAGDWDEDGNFYVAEMRAYMPDVTGVGEQAPIGAVVRLLDDNNDGVFDQRQVLIDDLVLPRAVRIVNEGLLIAEMGKLWLCPNNSGWSRDIDCSMKIFLGNYGEHQGSVEHAENGLMVGIDNWLYSAKSSRRLKLVNGVLAEEPTLFRGQWGMAQDSDSRLYYNTNSNMLIGDYFDGQALVEAGNATAPGLNQRISPNEEVFSIRVNPGVNRAYVPGVLREDGRLRTATSASGMVVYQGGLLPADAPDVFVAEPAANLIAAYELKKDGIAVSSEHRLYADAQWGQRDFLASYDERFRPVDILNAPDGTLYVIDFYRGVIQDHVFLSEELKAQAIERGLDRPLGMGRIWRIKPVGVQRELNSVDWRSLDTQALVGHLGSTNVWQQATAQRLLIRRQANDVGEQLSALLHAGSSAAQVRAMWILAERGELVSQHVKKSLQGDENIAEAAMLAGGEQLSVAELAAVVEHSAIDSRLVLYAIGSLRHAEDDAAVVAALRSVLRRSKEVYVRTFVQAAARGREFELIQGLIGAGEWRREDEAEGRLLETLSRQLVRAEGKAVSALLDYIQEAPPWVFVSVLDGLFQVTREPGFTRVELDQSHAIFGMTESSQWTHISQARRVFTWPGDRLAADAKPLTSEQAVRMAKGADFFASGCVNCHGAGGQGVGALGPPLADSPWVTQAPERLARIVLQGLMGPIEVAGTTWNSAMPGHKDYPGFDDDTASGLLTYLRRSWGHSGRAIDPEFVAQIRAETVGRTALWRVVELDEIDINSHFEKYIGAYGAPGRPLIFSYDGKQLNVASGIFNGPLVELKEDHFVFEPRGLKLEFILAVDSSVPMVRMATPEGGVNLPRLQP